MTVTQTLSRHPITVAGAGVAMALMGALAFRAADMPRRDPVAANLKMQQFIERGADLLNASLDALGQALTAPAHDSAAALRIRTAYRVSRERFKRIEAVAEFYAPSVTASLNSRRQEVDDDDAPPPSSLGVMGFPALDTLVWPAASPASSRTALVVLGRMHQNVVRLRALAQPLVSTDAQVIEVARLELARVSTLGIAGFDAQTTGMAMRESAAALDGMRALFDSVAPLRWPEFPAERADVDSAWKRAAEYLRAHPDFDSFDRLTFIAFYAEPAGRAIAALGRVASVTPVQILRAWRANAPTVYAAGAFDATAYAPSGAPVPTPALIALGAKLFSDPQLSGTAMRSCASCHEPQHAFADGLRLAAGIRAHGPTPARHTPTLINAALQPSQFDDERASTLEDQVGVVLSSASEMESSAEIAAAAISKSAEYRAQFAEAFGQGAGSAAVTPLRLRQALAAYVRTLVALDSRFDRAARGEVGVLTDEERRGFNLYMGKAGCGTCHFAPLFNGVTPPLYLSADVEVIGTPASAEKFAVLDADSGRAAIDHLPLHLRGFKTPSLRNVTQTGPYFHNGEFKTLDEVLRFYDGGGGRGAGARVANQTLNADSLHLSADDRKAIIAFLGTLTDVPSVPRSSGTREKF